MAHAREQVRDAVDTLLSASPTEWQIVFNSRIAPARDVTPYLLVYIESETTEPLDIHPGYTMMREMMLTVKARTRVIEGEQLEDKLDAMAEEIEQTLTTTALRAAVPKLKTLTLIGSNSDLVEDENERTFAEVALDWRVQVMTNEGVPETLV